MSENSNNQGRAYEYAWMNVLYEALSKKRKAIIVNNSSLHANEKAWHAMSESLQKAFMLSAISAVDTVLELEPLMTENEGDVLFLEFQKDAAGTSGDVRDIVIKRNSIQWEVGLSIKHNHDAVKHSRLSHKIDFGSEWFKIPCSKNYWDAVAPIFDKLKLEKSKKTKWSELADKDRSIYVPLLQAFMDEINRSYIKNVGLPKRMVEYLIGATDYYKAVSFDDKSMTVIRTFNIHGTLNKASGTRVSTITVPVVKLPTELVTLKFKKNSKNTVEMYLNNGWQLTFRIHNASTIVEPSLKFDVQLIGMPVSILSLECRWKRSTNAAV